VSTSRAKKKRRPQASAGGGGKTGAAADAGAAEPERTPGANGGSAKRAAPASGNDGGSAKPAAAAAAAASGDGGGSAKPAARASGGDGDGAAAARPSRADRVSRFEVRDGVQRPDAIWAPFPLTEIGMAAGLAIFIAGFATGGSRGGWLLAVGALVLVVVTGELSLREHFAGFRSHTMLLAVLPVVVLHATIALAISSDWGGPLALGVDVALAGGLAWLLHGRFKLAHERARDAA
jgi:hypothetical protein